ncbi:MAG: IS1595 family transposase [Candidatus Acidiferrales bacterium]
MNLNDIAKNYNSEDDARNFIEKLRWPEGAVCPHCGVLGESYRLAAKPESKHPVRPGVWKCGPCRKQFTVKVGTIFEDSHIPLATWLKAIHLLCASKKGMSAHQLHRMLGVTYKSAWFMAHRIRYAMSQEPLSSKLKGTIEVDETYVGGRRKGTKRGRPGRGSHKAPVVSLVQRTGNVRSFHVKRVTSKNLKEVIRKNVSTESNIMTDDLNLYSGLKKEFASHDVIRHKYGQYARRDGEKRIHTNTVEGYFALLKRGITGTFHHVSKQHLQRYLDEFDFRYNARKIQDGERAILAVKGTTGKRLKYRDSRGSTQGRVSLSN